MTDDQKQQGNPEENHNDMMGERQTPPPQQETKKTEDSPASESKEERLDLSEKQENLTSKPQETYKEEEKPTILKKEESIKNTLSTITQKIKLFLGGAILVIISIGMGMGIQMLRGTSKETSSTSIIIENPSTTQETAPCGQAPTNEGCAVYIQNTKNTPLRAGVLFNLASQISGRRIGAALIETQNATYSDQNIPPGKIAEIYVPTNN